MKYFRLFLIIPVVILFYGFPLNSPHSVGNPGKDKADKKLLGSWEAEDASRQFFKLNISKKDDTEFILSVEEKGKLFELPEDSFRLYTAKLEGMNFMYIKPVKEGGKGFYYFTYEISGKGQLLVDEVDANNVDKNALYSSESLQKYFAAKMNNSNFTTGKQLWRKVE